MISPQSQFTLERRRGHFTFNFSVISTFFDPFLNNLFLSLIKRGNYFSISFIKRVILGLISCSSRDLKDVNCFSVSLSIGLEWSLPEIDCVTLLRPSIRMLIMLIRTLSLLYIRLCLKSYLENRIIKIQSTLFWIRSFSGIIWIRHFISQMLSNPEFNIGI